MCRRGSAGPKRWRGSHLGKCRFPVSKNPCASKTYDLASQTLTSPLPSVAVFRHRSGSQPALAVAWKTRCLAAALRSGKDVVVRVREDDELLTRREPVPPARGVGTESKGILRTSAASRDGCRRGKARAQPGPKPAADRPEDPERCGCRRRPFAVRLAEALLRAHPLRMAPSNRAEGFVGLLRAGRDADQHQERRAVDPVERGEMDAEDTIMRAPEVEPLVHGVPGVEDRLPAA